MKTPRIVVLALCLSVIACGHHGEPSGAVLTGFVRGSNGAGLQDATVQVLGKRSGAVTTTDANGAYRLDDLNLGFTTLLARANGYADSRQYVTVDGTNTLDFTLVPGSTGSTQSSLSGFVRTPSSTPVPGVLVRVTSGNAANLTATTGIDGRYTFSSLPTGPTMLAASAPDFVDATGSVTVGAGNFDFTMRRTPGSISETLTGTISGEEAGCLGDGDPYDAPCRRFPPFEVTNSGQISIVLTWQTNNSVGFSLEIRQRSQPVATAPGGQPAVINRTLSPGIYEIWVWYGDSGTETFSLNVTRPK